MLYMGNVNKFIWYLLIPIMLLFYISFLLWEENKGHKMAATLNSFIHQSNISKLSELDGLILGGSNAFFGISAAMLTKDLDRQWYNLSMISEGRTDKNYWNFVSNTITEDARNEVDTIIYSSATHLRTGSILKRSKGETTQAKVLFLSTQPLVSYFKRFFLHLKEEAYNPSDQLGNKDFDRYDCLENNQKVLSENNRETDETTLRFWVSSQLENITGLFPNSKIIFVIPSEYYLKDNLKRSQKHASIIKDEILSFTSSNEMDITLLRQSEFTSLEMVCTDSLHASSLGREWRTNEILDYLNVPNPLDKN